MRVDEAETRLREMFAEAGLDSPDVDLRTAARTAWTTYKAFAAEPVDVAANDPDVDMVLFEIGAADWEDGRRTFNLMLTRQFVLNDASGEYDHMEHLHCHLYCDLTPELERLGFDTGVFFRPPHIWTNRSATLRNRPGSRCSWRRRPRESWWLKRTSSLCADSRKPA